MQRIVVIGGGFAGFWSAVGAARKLDELGFGSEVEVILVSRDGYLGIRPRYYEKDLSGVRVSLDHVLEPVDVKRLEGNVNGIDFYAHMVRVETAGDEVELTYDQLVLAAGSQLFRPDIPGIDDHAFSVDTYAEALELEEHLRSLPSRPEAPGRFTVAVIGAGFTGIEVATEMVERMQELAEQDSESGAARVVLVEQAPHVGPDLGANPRPVIEEALGDLGVKMRLGARASFIDEAGVTLDTGERVPTLTTVWIAGMRASPLTELFPVERDRQGRLPVDENMKVIGMENVFAAGDVCRAMTDDEHVAMQSCQHAIPQGKWAGHNAASNLLGEDLLPYRQEAYVTCLDLGAWGALFTNGWERIVKSIGAEAKEIKQNINRKIYPPASGDKQELFEAARPTFEPVR